MSVPFIKRLQASENAREKNNELDKVKPITQKYGSQGYQKI